MLPTGAIAVPAVPDRPLAERPEPREPEASDGQFAGLMAQFIQPAPAIPGEPTEPSPKEGDTTLPESPGGPGPERPTQTPGSDARTPVASRTEGGATLEAGIEPPQGLVLASPDPAAPTPAQLPPVPGPSVAGPSEPRVLAEVGPPAGTRAPLAADPAGIARPGVIPEPTDPSSPTLSRPDELPVPRALNPVTASSQTPAVLAVAVALPRPSPPKVEPAAKAAGGTASEPVLASSALLDGRVIAPPQVEAPVPEFRSVTSPLAVSPSEKSFHNEVRGSETPRPAAELAVESASDSNSPAPRTAEQAPLTAEGSLPAPPEASLTRAVGPGHTETTALTAAGAPVPPPTRISAPASTAPPAPAGAPPPPPAGPVVQVDQSLRWMLKGGAQEARLQLHPESLGQVTIHLKVEGGEVHARLWVTEPASIRVVQEGRAHLEQSLHEQGLQLGSFDLQQGHRPFQEAPSAPTFRDRTQPLVPAARQEAPAAPSPSILNPHHVELYA